MRGKAKADGDDEYVAYSQERWSQMLPIIEEFLRKDNPRWKHRKILAQLAEDYNFHPS